MKILIIIFLATYFNNSAQSLYEKQIVPFDGLDNDFFGRSIAVSDSFLFISSLRYSNPVENAVYVYELKNNDYLFRYKIFPSDTQAGVSGALFGSTLLLKDNQLFVGAQNKKLIGNMPTGAVYVFEYENYKWVEKQRIIPPFPEQARSFSTSFSKSNEFFLVGAPVYTPLRPWGSAFLYKYIEDKYILYQEFTPLDGKDDQFFGSSVLIKDDLIIIASLFDSTDSGIGSGSVYVYYRHKEDSLWSFTQKYLPELNSDFLAFGSAIVANNENIFIGTTDNINYLVPGEVYIYKYIGQDLELLQKIESGDKYFDDRFGISLFAKGDSLLVGAIFDTVKSYNTGTAYLFVNENGNWNKKYKIYPSNETNANWFGDACIITDDKIFIGAHQTRVDDISIGSVYIYSPQALSVINENDNEFDLNDFYLSQNYPNPFNSSTKIDFYIPVKGRVNIKIYDITGKEVKKVLDELKSNNQYSFNIDFENLPSGVYFYKIQYLYEDGNKIYHSSITKKAVLIK